MNIGEITQKMIGYCQGNRHDINHFLKVYAFARTIGECERLDPHTQRILEIAAVVHDIACPLCRAKYGSASGHLQEKESPALLADFLADTGLEETDQARIVYLVSHHHTYAGVDGLDYQILLEADYLVNADEGRAAPDDIRRMRENVFRTATGVALLDSIYLNHLAE